MEDKIVREVLRKLINILENGDTCLVTKDEWECIQRYPCVIDEKTRHELLKELENEPRH